MAQPSNERSDKERPLTFAVVSDSASAERDLATLCGELGRALSSPVRPLVLASYASLEQEVEAGHAQIVWAPPRVAIDLEDAGLVSIDVCCTRGGGNVAYFAALFTQHASRIETLADLKGCRAVWVDPHSAAGYLVPRARLASEGLDPDALFGREDFLGTHARVACAVLAGEADVGATYLSLDPKTGRPLSAGWLDAGAGINGAFILATGGPIPTDAIVLSRRVPAERKAVVVEQVIALASCLPEVVGRLFGADGFAPAQASHFEGARALLRGARR